MEVAVPTKVPTGTFVLIAQWIERQLAELKVGGSSPPGDAKQKLENTGE